jgi:signal transduction histidine kinase
MIWSWLNRNPLLLDVSLVGVLIGLGIGAEIRNGDAGPVGIALTIAEAAPLLVRRRYPVGVVVMVTAVVLAMIAIGIWVLPLQLGVALYTLTSIREQPADRAVGILAILAVGIAILSVGGIEFGAGAARAVFLIAAAVVGDSIRSRRAYIREIEQKADRLERERASETRRAAAEEQARIARELHDVIAHALSVIVVQAGAADDAFEADPARARDPIRAIDAAARAALADLRRVLGILQSSAEYEPQPGLDQLDRLVDQVRATGLHVSVEIEGALRPLPAAIDLSAFRIVQEALTNSLKHAEAQHVRVRIRYGDALELEINDDGRGDGYTEGDSRGNGLVGMRQRVALLGGMFAAGSGPDGGYRVAATIPIDEVM